jgi:hypothetical protein
MGAHRRVVRREQHRAGRLFAVAFGLVLGVANMFIAGCWLAMDRPANAIGSAILALVIPGAILASL